MLVVFNKHNTARVASCWFIIYYRLVMHGHSNIKFCSLSFGKVSVVRCAPNCKNTFWGWNSPCTWGVFFERTDAQCGITWWIESINCSVWPHTSFHGALNYQQRPSAGFALERIFQYSGSRLAGVGSGSCGQWNNVRPSSLLTLRSLKFI